MDVLGKALKDFHFNESPSKLWIRNEYGAPEEMPLDTYFRDKEEMPELELCALGTCVGHILDVGAGAGSHALELQTRGAVVDALDISAGACTVMRRRGVRSVLNTNIFDFKSPHYDTLLLLMNGIGLCGDLNGLKRFLKHAKLLLKPGGKLLFDSSDVDYLYKDGFKRPDAYYGEIAYQYEYKGLKTDWFKWLYIDFNTLCSLANEDGWLAQQIYKDEFDQYLCKLTLK